MRRVELQDQNIEIILTGLTMLEALQSRISIPYSQILEVSPTLNVPPDLMRVGGTALGPIQEGHFISKQGFYFLSYENPSHVMTIKLDNFRIGRQHYCGVAVEVADPQSMAEAIQRRLSPAQTE